MSRIGTADADPEGAVMAPRSASRRYSTGFTLTFLFGGSGLRSGQCFPFPRTSALDDCRSTCGVGPVGDHNGRGHALSTSVHTGRRVHKHTYRDKSEFVQELHRTFSRVNHELGP